MWLFRAIFSVLGFFGIGQAKDWFIAAREKNGSLYILRARKKKPQGISQGGFSILAKICWQYKDDGCGLPTDSEDSTMGIFEEYLDPRIESNNIGYLMSITTGHGLREWNWYVNDAGKFKTELFQCLPQVAQNLTVLEFMEDQEWKIWEGKIKEVRNKLPSF